MKISVLVLAKNEEDKIGNFLEQLDFASEIIVLDQSSTDQTAKIASKYTSLIYQTKSEDFSNNRNTLLSYAKEDWVLYLDCDEQLDDNLKQEIGEKITKGKSQAYYFARKNYILGKWLSHGGWWPDYVPKLFEKKYLLKWQGQVHESPVVRGKFGRMKNPLTHNTASNVQKMLAKTTKWAKIEANLAYQAKHPKVTVPKTIKAMFIEFFTRYFNKIGFLDGRIGLLEAIFQAFHRAAVLVYLWELQNSTEEKFSSLKNE